MVVVGFACNGRESKIERESRRKQTNSGSPVVLGVAASLALQMPRVAVALSFYIPPTSTPRLYSLLCISTLFLFFIRFFFN